jgi:hypothetical protein
MYSSEITLSSTYSFAVEDLAGPEPSPSLPLFFSLVLLPFLSQFFKIFLHLSFPPSLCMFHI